MQNVQRMRRQTNKIKYRRNLKSNSAFNRNSIIFSSQSTSGTITGLKPNSINYATISVLNGQNEGGSSEIITFRTAEGGNFNI